MTLSQLIHEGLHFVGMGYFEKTLTTFPKNSIFVVFSDRINWCRERFTKKFPDLNFVFIEGNDHIQDLILMSLMKHQVLSKSTFSWWAAYLNKNSEKIVLAPVNESLPLPKTLKVMLKTFLGWFGKHYWSNEEYYLPDWKMISYELEEYPEDIYAYGGESTSVEKRDK